MSESMRRTVDLFTGISQGVPDPEDPDVATVAWGVKEGVEILDAHVLEGTLLVMRVRVPESVRDDS